MSPPSLDQEKYYLGWRVYAIWVPISQTMNIAIKKSAIMVASMSTSEEGFLKT